MKPLILRLRKEVTWIEGKTTLEAYHFCISLQLLYVSQPKVLAASESYHLDITTEWLDNWREVSDLQGATKHVAENTTKLHPHTKNQTQYRQHAVKEHDHHWNSQQYLN
jgi:hypothetical protein